MRYSWARLLRLLTVVGCLVFMPRAFAATIIVTEEEGRLPLPKEMPAPSDRGITRAPKIELDADDKTVLRAPLHLKITFKAFGNSAIDLGSFYATYIKDPSVDLTDRLKPFAQQAGINIPDAQFPPGDHYMQLAIKDFDGRTVTKIFKLRVAP